MNSSKLWSEPEEAKDFFVPSSLHPLLGTKEDSPLPSWINELSLRSYPSLRDHRIMGSIIFPAAAYFEMMRAAVINEIGAAPIELSNVHLLEALYLNSDDEILLKTTVDTQRRYVRIFSKFRGGDGDWIERCAAKYAPLEWREDELTPLKLSKTLPVERFYGEAQTAGYDYGPKFRCLSTIAFGKDCIEARIENTDSSIPSDKSELDPALLDSCLQTMIAHSLVNERTNGNPEIGQLHLPTHFEKIQFFQGLNEGAIAQLQMQHDEARDRCFDIAIGNEKNQLTLRIFGIRTSPIHRSEQSEDPSDQRGVYYSETLTPIGPFDEAMERPHHWLSVGRGGIKFQKKLLEELRSEGQSVSQFNKKQNAANYLNDIYQCLKKTAHQNTSFGAIFSDFFIGAKHAHATDPENLIDRTIAVTEIVKGLIRLPHAAHPQEVWFLTKKPRNSPAFQHSAIGYLRTLTLELPEIKFHIAEFENANSDELNNFVEILQNGSKESELFFSNRAISVPRLHEINRLPEATIISQRSHPQLNNRQLVQKKRGRKDQLYWQKAEAPLPTRKQALVKVSNIGLNFRDLLAVTDMLPKEAEIDDPIDHLGLEFSGIIHSLPSSQTKLQIGDRVFGMARGICSDFITVDLDKLYPIPKTMSHEQAASFSAAYLTAEYALCKIAKLKRDEKILIHQGSGGVGLAAISIAKSMGAEIFATASNSYKRDFLRKLGVHHVYHSRNLDFADNILADTGNIGVDIVVNSLSGQFLDKSLDCLAPFGRFVELGKRDLYADAPLGLKSLTKNISFHVVDLMALLADRNDQCRVAMNKLLKKVKSGQIRPLPYKCFPMEQISEAFDQFSSSEHVGKILVQTDQQKSTVRNASNSLSLDPKGAYLVVGGNRGFGLEIVKWLAENGAGQIVALSKSGQLSKSEKAEVKRLNKIGCSIKSLVLDVTKEKDVDRFIANQQKSKYKIKGIVHGVAVYKDNLLEALTNKEIRQVMKPKMIGASNLTRSILNADCKLEFFVSFSSFAYMLGWSGQAHYAAANAYLATMAHYQQSKGIPGKTIIWGALGEAGHVSRTQSIHNYLESSGWISMGNHEALNVFRDALISENPITIYAGADWTKLARTNEKIAQIQRLKGLTQSREQQSAAANDIQKWRSSDITAETINQFVRDQLSKVLRLDIKQISQIDSLDEAGLDSLSSFELLNRLESETGLSIPLRTYSNARSISALAQVIAEAIAHHKSNETAETEKKPATDPTKANSDTRLPIEQWFMDTIDKPMTSPYGKCSLFDYQVIELKSEVSSSSLVSAWNKIWELYEDRWRNLLNSSSMQSISFVESYVCTNQELRSYLSSESTFEVPLRLYVQGSERTKFIAMRLSRALADDYSADKFLFDFLSLAFDPNLQVNANFDIWSDYLRSITDQLSGHRTQQHQSYWNTILNEAPRAINFDNRCRALAPSGLGINSGPAKTIRQSIEFNPSQTDTNRIEALGLWLFAKTLTEFCNQDQFIIELALREPNLDLYPQIVGPLTKHIPIVVNGTDQSSENTKKLIDAARRHSSFDIYRCEMQFAEIWHKQEIVPKQISFEFRDEAGNTNRFKHSQIKSIERIQLGTQNDLKLLLSHEKDSLELAFIYDSDVLNSTQVDKMLDCFCAHIRAVISKMDSKKYSTLDNPAVSENRL